MVFGLDFALEDAAGQGDGELHHLVVHGLQLAALFLLRLLLGVLDDDAGLLLRLLADGLGVLVRLRHDLCDLGFGIAARLVQDLVALRADGVGLRLFGVELLALLGKALLPALHELGDRLVQQEAEDDVEDDDVDQVHQQTDRIDDCA